MTRPGQAVLCVLLAAAPCAAQTQFAQTGQEYLPGQTESPQTDRVEVADLDGDGDLDLVVAEATDAYAYARASVATYFNDGAGHFTFGQVLWRNNGLALPVVPIVVLDFDQDGDLDVRIFDLIAINNGAGVFPGTVTSIGRPGMTDMVAGDIDGDGDVDVLEGWNAPPGSTWRVNFGTPTLISSNVLLEQAQAVALFDSDGDNDLDAVVAVPPGLTTPGRTVLYENDGTGQYTEVPASRYPQGAGSTLSFASGDIDGDGDNDLVLGNVGPNRLLLNVGGGAFVDSTGGRLTTEWVVTESIELVDLDGDGDRDLLLGEYEAFNRIHWNDGTGRFTPAGPGSLLTSRSPTRASAVADLDGDGRLDLLFGNEGHNTLYHGLGGGRFTLAGDASLPSRRELWYGAHLFDADGDGDLDMVTADFGRTREELYLNDGTGRYTLSPGALPDDGNYTWDVDSGDVDGDGDEDLILASGLWPNALYLNDGSGRFVDASSRIQSAQGDDREVTILDIDGDGDLDAVVRNWAPRLSKVLINDGTGRFVNEGPSRLPGSLIAWRLSHDFADLDGDGDFDLFISGLGNHILLNDGQGSFTDVTATALPPGIPSGLETGTAGDVDGDGDVDVIIGTTLLRNDGNAMFSWTVSYAIQRTTTSTEDQTLADVDNDGDLDLIVAGDVCEVLHNNGTGWFTSMGAKGFPADATYAQRVEVGDVDGDEDTDVLFVGWQYSRLYRNRHRQLATPATPLLGRTWRIDLHARPGYGVLGKTAFAAIGVSGPSLALPPLGTWSLAPAPLLVLPAQQIAPGSSLASYVLGIPNVPAASGAPLAVQGGILDQDGDSHFTNLVTDAIR